MLLVAAVVPWTVAAAMQVRTRAWADTSWIVIDDAGRGPRHAITLDDILSVREVGEPQLSPDGQWVAFLVRQAFRDCNCYRVGLFLVAARGGPAPRKLVEEAAITNLRWTPDGQFLTYLSTRSGSRQVWRVSRAGGPPAPLFTHRGDAPAPGELGPHQSDPTPVAVDQYEWSPDGSQLAFSTRPAPDSARLRRLREGGVLYDDEHMWMLDIVLKQWRREQAEVWAYDSHTGTERRIWQAPVASALPRSPGITSMAWSPDGSRLVVSYPSKRSSTTGWLDYDLGILNPVAMTFRPLVGSDSSWETHPTWSKDGRSIAFAAEPMLPLDPRGTGSALGIVNVATGERRYFARGKTGAAIARLWWMPGETMLAFESATAGGARRERSGLYQVELGSGRVRRLTSGTDHLSGCSPIVAGAAACVQQGPSVPPEPAVVNMHNGHSRLIANTHPELRDMVLGEVTELRWKNKYGVETNGYFIKPNDYSPGRRYPLLLILYGFEGRFLAQAEWIPNYPAQAFAREGFGVLLWNYPRWGTWEGNDFSRGSIADGYGGLSSLEAAVGLLARQGVVDTARVGIMGISHGGFWTSFALTKSSVFKVASICNAGDWNPGLYWLLGSQPHRVFFEKFMGGPPFGSTLKNWLSYSPAMNADRVRAPFMMEYGGEEALIGLEWFTALRRHNVPVEYVIYPDEGHVLAEPAHRFASMQRNLDWFGFWLLGKEDPAPAKRDQYARWRAMRKQSAEAWSAVSEQ